jgi:hypothetical protein
MTFFLQNAWYLWWILATLVILRWFHLCSSGSHERALEAVDLSEVEVSTTSKQIPDLSMTFIPEN